MEIVDGDNVQECAVHTHPPNPTKYQLLAAKHDLRTRAVSGGGTTTELISEVFAGMPLTAKRESLQRSVRRYRSKLATSTSTSMTDMDRERRHAASLTHQMIRLWTQEKMDTAYDDQARQITKKIDDLNRKLCSLVGRENSIETERNRAKIRKLVQFNMRRKVNLQKELEYINDNIKQLEEDLTLLEGSATTDESDGSLNADPDQYPESSGEFAPPVDSMHNYYVRI